MMMKRVIFLDCDGVLNNAETSVIEKHTGFIGIDEENLACLVRLVKQSHADLVLTSTWQHEPYMLRYLKRKLFFKWIFIKDITDENSIYRGRGIRRYLYRHPSDAYVILDDFEFPDFNEEIPDHFVMTDFKIGLTNEDVEKALQILQCF